MPETEAEMGEVVVEGEAVVVDAFEERARRMGWRPLEDWNGPEGRWVDAKTFIERGESELPVLRERYRKQDTVLANTERELIATRTDLNETKAKLGEVTTVMTEIRDMSRTAETRAYNRAMSDFQERERRAVEQADTAEFDRIQHEKRQLAPPVTPPPAPVYVAPPVPAAPPAPVANPIIEGWIAENPWFINDNVLNGVAIALDREVKTTRPDLSVREQLDEVKRQVVARFPEKFDNPRRAAAPAVATPSGTPPKPKGKSIKDLPREAQDAFARFKRQMPNFTEAEYMALYEGQQ